MFYEDSNNMSVFYYIIVFFTGLALGSFLNAWVFRTRENIKISKGRSICIFCHRRLAWYENIPVFSFIFLKGKCKVCHKRISWQYPLVELAMAIVFTLSAWWHGPTDNFLTAELLRDWVLIFNLGFIFLYDLRYGEILDAATLPTALLLFLFSFVLGWQTWQSMLVGVAVGAGIFLFQYLLSRGKWIGGGDIYLGLLMGVILGWPDILIALLLAYVLGGAVSVFLVGLKKKELRSETPFGTYLAFATFMAMFFGEKIVSWYVGLLM